jgi:hypothetical protein
LSSSLIFFKNKYITVPGTPPFVCFNGIAFKANNETNKNDDYAIT